MKPRHCSLRFYLFGELLCLIIGLLILTESIALALSGKIREFAVPTAGSVPLEITMGPDGVLWFTEVNGNNIGRITTGGIVTEDPIPTAGSVPVGIRKGLDNKLWFTESNTDYIGQLH